MFQQDNVPEHKEVHEDMVIQVWCERNEVAYAEL